MRVIWVAAVLVIPGVSHSAQEAPPNAKELPEDLPESIERAVTRGLDFLKIAPDPTAHPNFKNADELILLACLHGGMSEEDPFFKKLLDRTLAAPLIRTYKVALQAMVLEAIDRVTYQLRIAECGQFLVDNQCQNGQWSYGNSTDTSISIKGIRPIVWEPSKRWRQTSPSERKKPKVVRRIMIKPTQSSVDLRDNSNSQYAALGIRACRDAGIGIPKSVITKARDWWVQSQHPPVDGESPRSVVTSRLKARPRGWCYKSRTTKQHRKAYSAMTVGAVGVMCIYDSMMRKNWKQDPAVVAGVAWLEANFVVNKNNYYMYGLERAGMLFGSEKFGGHDWFLEGSNYLLAAQNENGSWGSRSSGMPKDVWDTCFAILFLKKATGALGKETGK